jgi:hypothetical protein
MFINKRLAAMVAGIMVIVASAAYAYGPIQASGSDTQSVNYNVFQASTITPYINANTSGGKYQPVAAVTGPLTLAQASSVRLYFVASDAGFNNRIGLSTNGDYTSSAAKDIFARNSVNAGDFVDLGTFAAGTTLDFYLNANNGAYGALWWNTTLQNISPAIFGAGSDQTLEHIKISTFSQDGKTYLLLAWEDLAKNDPSQDLDYNDFFAVAEIIPQLGVPEPLTYLIMGSMLGVGIVIKRSRRRLA